RRWHPKSGNEVVDKMMAKLRELLNELGQVLREEQEEELEKEEEEEEDFNLDNAVEDDGVVDAQTMMEDLNVKEDEGVKMKAT
ncbi:hypothetical protein EJ02DRAFT_335093, partial [Clathrospora elynae]